MKLIFKYLKSYAVFVLLCILLLFGQAATELSLPNYMSEIVNIGIQQGGIEEAMPKVLDSRAQQLLLSFMDPEDQNAFSAAYAPVEKGSAQEQTLQERFPEIAEMDALALSEETEAGVAAYARGCYAFMTFLQDMAGQSGSVLDTDSGIQNVDTQALYDLLPLVQQIPPEALQAVIEQAQRVDQMICTQTAAAFTKVLYQSMQVDLSAMQQSYIWLKGLQMLGIALLGVAAAIGVGFIGSWLSAAVARKMRQDVFEKIEHFSHAEFDRFSTASLITRTTNDVTQVQMLIGMGLRLMCYAPIMGVGGVIFAVQKSPSMSWILALAVGVMLTLTLALIPVVLPKFKILQKLTDRLNLISRENLSGLLVVRAFGNERFESDRFDTANRDLTAVNRFTQRAMASSMPLIMLVMNLTSILIVWVGGHAIQDSALQVGDMLAYIQYAMQVITSFLFIVMIFIMVPRALVSAERIREVLDTPLSITDPEAPEALTLPIESLQFDDVSFRYGNAEQNTLEHIRFTAKPGETVAIIGATGSGKSTLVNLIPRFYDVTEGAVRINGKDIRGYAQQALRDQIGYIPQKSVLFSGTIQSNLQYGKADADTAALLEAIEHAQAAEFVSQLPDGVKNSIAQGGTNVSGGQKQRLAIARALVKKAPIYIFDDSFSALDFKTDARLRKTLKEIMQNAIVLIVAQRVSTIMQADRILVLEEGRVVGQGTHRQLLQTCAAYREIAESQLSKEELA